jgi:glycosyltransferase involved in cell wall biosynthesis
LVVVSEYARRALLRERIGRPEDVVTIHNGLPLERYERQPRGTLRTRLNLPDSAWLVGSLGRFTRWKGQGLFLRIAEEYIRRNPRAHFALIGHAFNEDQPFERELREFVRIRGLRERIHFVPFQRDVTVALSDLDVLLHTSEKPEPFGRVIIEAMSVGVPVIAARDGGVPEIITEGHDGLLATPGSLNEYLAAMDRLLLDETLRARLSEAARETVARRFSVKRVGAEFERLFRECTS